MATARRSTKRARAKNQPIHEIRLGRIRAAIWLNETEMGQRHNVTVSRLYKDGDEWRDSTSFGRDDLLLLTKVCDMCHSWIFEQASAVNGNGRRPGEDYDEDEEAPF